MKRKASEEFGIFNVLLVGKNPRSVSIADNIHAKFKGGTMKNSCDFNIVTDIESDVPSNSWFNEFIFDMTTNPRFNNIIVANGFVQWYNSAKDMELLYMKKLLQSLNVVIVDISEEFGESEFFSGIPTYRFNDQKDFLDDLFKWIDWKMDLVVPHLATINLIRSLCGKHISFLGDAFGSFSGTHPERIVKDEYMRFDAPILFDEFCKVTKGMTFEDIDKCLITRSSSALSVFFK